MKPLLICFPFAGGSKYSYNLFAKEATLIKLLTIEYPGRGSRSNEKILKDMDMIIDDAYSQIKSYINQPYAFYGHSMGTIVAYLLTKRIISDGYSQPIHLFMSGKGGPSVNDITFQMHRLPKKEFIKKLKEMDSSFDEVWNNTSLMEYFEPILKSDFEAIETYKYEKAYQLDVPVTVMFGREDNKIEEIKAWQKETSKTINIIEFPGKHFFINEYASEIIKVITNILTMEN